jgi:peptide/nickel transport system permease protein
MAMAGLGWIFLSALTATLGYLITPDSTPFANHQQLEVAAHQPGTRVDMLFVRKNAHISSRNPFRTMIFGRTMPYATIPIQRYWFIEHYLYYETYAGEPGFPGLEGRFKLPDVAFALDTEATAEVTSKNTVTFRDIDGKQHEASIDALRQKAEDEHIRSRRYLLGTDRFGRDMLSQLIIGTRVSLSVGFIAVIISLVIGLTLGSLAGYFRGRLDDFIVWLINVIWSVPTLLLVIAITFAIGKGFWQVFLAVGLTMWVEVARIVRGQVISLREKEFIESARALGLNNLRIIRRHILPNIMGPVIVISAANFASAILIEAGLSFLGIGVQPPMPSWGTMIREHYGFIILDKGYLAFLPGLLIMLMVLSFMLAGNGLRDALDRTARF